MSLLLSTFALAAPEPLVCLLLALTCLASSCGGSMAGLALLVYSPTKLARRLPPDPADPRAADGIPLELETRGREYAIAAWIVAFGGAAGWIPLLATAWDLAWVVPAGAIALLLASVALPLALVEARAEAIVLCALPALRVGRWLLRPAALPVATIIRLLQRALRIPNAPRTPEQIADEIVAAVIDSASENALEEQERGWIENIVELKDLKVSEAMTPRTDVIGFDAEMDLRDAVQRAIRAGHSRYPVYEGRIDSVIGVFYAKDALALLSSGQDKRVKLREVVRKPLFVPETMGVSELLQRFKAAKLHMAIVLDEYGGTAGLISIEDILEEIVGDIRDEFERDEDKTIRRQGDLVEIAGRARIDEVNETLGCSIPENPEYDTLAGFVFTTLGKIPKAGETVHIGDLELRIAESDERRIGRVQVRLPIPTPEPSR